MCTSPLKAWKNGKGISFKSPKKVIRGVKDVMFTMEVEIPCGQCIECKIAKARDWAVRIMHDVQMEAEINGRESTFVTLTYNDENVPRVFEEKDGYEEETDRMTLRKDHLKKFLGQLREKLRRRGTTKIRYFACGEYGDVTKRPHYHCILIGAEFKDKYLYSKSKGGYEIYRSDLLEDTWTYGDSSIQEVTFNSCEYCAKDVVKRIKGSEHEKHKKWLRENNVTSVDEYYNGRIQEFSTKSRMPGLGARWIDKYHKDVFPHCKIPKINGVHLPVPRYYIDRIIKKEMEETAEQTGGLLPDESLSRSIHIARYGKSETKERKRKRQIDSMKLRKDDHIERLDSRNEIKKHRRKSYEQFKQGNKAFFDI